MGVGEGALCSGALTLPQGPAVGEAALEGQGAGGFGARSRLPGWDWARSLGQ